MRSCSRSAIDTLQRHTLHLQVREASWLSLNRSLVGKYITKNSMNELQTIQSKISDTCGEIVMYQPDETIRLEVRLGEDTVWLSQQQMAELFGKDRTVIGRHIRNIYKEEELEWDTTCAKFAHMGSDGDQDKDLGKKWFAFTLMYDLSPAMLTEHLNEKAKNTPEVD